MYSENYECMHVYVVGKRGSEIRLWCTYMVSVITDVNNGISHRLTPTQLAQWVGVSLCKCRKVPSLTPAVNTQDREPPHLYFFFPPPDLWTRLLHRTHYHLHVPTYHTSSVLALISNKLHQRQAQPRWNPSCAGASLDTSNHVSKFSPFTSTHMC
jgi:hypothetical protein